jgi:glycosyltransferase involved in cell wall biosynthesis
MTSHKLRIADELVGVRLFDVSPGEMYFSALDRYFEKRDDDLPFLDARDFGALLHAVIVKFAAEAQRARDVLGARTFVVPNGVPRFERARTTPRDTDRLEGRKCPRAIRTGTFVIGTLARISPDKKLEELIDAARELARRGVRFELRVAGRIERGADAYAKDIREAARDLPVAWCGELDAPAFLADLDAFAMVSEPEGCPNALLEAMGAGLPVAATGVGGASEAIEDGESGLLVGRGDGRALGRALARIATDPDLAGRLGDSARKRIGSAYDVERMTNDYERIFGLKPLQ